jgi:hypothetical protein
MDHNEFDFQDDLLQPFYYFLLQCGIYAGVEHTSKRDINNNGVIGITEGEGQ